MRVSKLGAKGWRRLIKDDREKVKEMRSHIHDLATETGLEISEFRKIVTMVQKGEREARQAKEMVEANLRLVISIAGSPNRRCMLVSFDSSYCSRNWRNGESIAQRSQRPQREIRVGGLKVLW